MKQPITSRIEDCELFLLPAGVIPDYHFYTISESRVDAEHWMQSSMSVPSDMYTLYIGKAISRARWVIREKPKANEWGEIAP